MDVSIDRVVSQKCVRWYGLDLSPARYIDSESLGKYESIRFLQGGDLLWNSTGTGTIGRACLVPHDLNNTRLVVDSHVTIVRAVNINTQFLWRWIQTPLVQEAIEFVASGTTNQIELNTSTVINHLMPLPPLAEQNRIIAKIDELMVFCDSLEQQINATTRKQAELLNALMHAQSQSNTEKNSQSVSCSKAQILDLAIYRASIGGYALNKLANAQYFGRTAAAKVMYMAQAHVGLELNLRPERQAAGPLDTWIYDFERQGQNNQWFEVNEKILRSGKQKTEYRCLPALSELVATAEKLMSPQQQSEFDRLIYALADKKTEEVEVIATLFAVWNDFLIDGIQPSDEQIIADFRENWHERKARFTTEELERWLGWLRRENIIPQGFPPRTVQQPRLLDH